MSEDAAQWQAGRQAWDRLEAWYRTPRAFGAAQPGSGDDALTALADIGVARRLLDQAELEAVRNARRHGRSWAEIAVKLGVTRQSAWERWRDLDETASAPPAAPAAPTAPDDIERSFEDDYDELEAQLLTDPGLPARMADELQPQMFMVTVPKVTAMTRHHAQTVLRRVNLIAVGPDSDGVPLDAVSDPDDIVIDQSPEADAKVPPGTSVMLWTDRRGGSGVHEPRRPMPDPKTDRAMRDETTGDVVN